MCNFATQILVSFAFLIYMIIANTECDNWPMVVDHNCDIDSQSSENCYYNCDFNQGCKCDTFLPGNSSSLTISCNYLEACTYSNIYCPSDSIDACTIYIDNEGSSLKKVNIYVPSTYTYGYLNLLNKEERLQEKYSGFAITTNCVNANGTIISQTDITFDTWYKCETPDCCPWHMPQFCDINKDCNISCFDTDDCAGSYIDGSLSTNLDITCYGQNDCINTTIVCPFNGSCSVTCSNYHSCFGMKIYYKELNPMVPNGDYTIHPGAHVFIYCDHDNSCEDMDILTPNATSVTLMCNNKDNHYNHHQGICNNIRMDAVNVDALHVLCLNDLACVDMYIDGMNAKELILYVRSLDTSAWYRSTIIATNSDYAEIDCESDVLFYSACSDSKYYMPSSGFVLNCYGYGCYYFGDIYVEDDLSESSFNYDGCGYCGSVLNCTSKLQIHCNEKPVCNISTWDDDLTYQPFDNCGCETVYIDAMKNFKMNGTTCVNRYIVAIDEELKPNENPRSWIAILAGLGSGVFFIGIVGGLFWWRQKRNEQIINTTIGNVMMVQLNDIRDEEEEQDDTQQQNEEVTDDKEVEDNDDDDDNNDTSTIVPTVGGGLDDDNIMEKCQM